MEQGQFFKKSALIGNAFKVFDIVVIISSGLAVYHLKFDKAIPEHFQLFLLLVTFIAINIFSLASVYRAWRGHSIFKELSQLTIAFFFVVLITGTILFLSKMGQNFSRLWVGWTFTLSFFCLIGYRVVIRLLMRNSRSAGFNQKKVIIIGAGALGKRACKAMLTEKWAGLRPVGFFDDDKLLIGQSYQDIKVLDTIDHLMESIEKQRQIGEPIDQVWIALPLSSQARIEELQIELQDSACNVYFVPDLLGFNLASYKVDEIVGLPVMNMSAKTMHGASAYIKRFEDIVISSLLLIILSPVLITIAILVKLDSAGPIIFKQRRYGQDGKEILVWKFRSMTVTEDGDSVTQAKREDSRVTKLGGILRKTSLDELPQLINVLQGSMSLVGPRPHAVAHNEHYRKKVQGYMIRHQIRPGITGWAQVNGCRGETLELSDMEERIRYDLDYIRNWSVFLDIQILFRTISTVVNFKDTY